MSLDLKITNFKEGQLPEVDKIPKELLELLGENGMRELISKHYDCLRTSSIKHLFPAHSDEAFDMAKKHSADFFIQLCGGPKHFEKSRGAPMMRQRHAKFQITADARVVWLECFRNVVLDLDIPDETKQGFWNYLDPFSFWMVNS